MHLKTILHALLFSSTEPLPLSELTRLVRQGASSASKPEFEAIDEKEILQALEELQEENQSSETAPLQLQEISNGWRYVTSPIMAPWVRLLQPEPKPARLSVPALETLAIIAYRQPVSRAEIEAVRGVAVGGTLETLIEKNLIESSSRSDLPGRPLLYHTTPFFLEYLGLRNLDELPNAHELKSRPIPTASPSAIQSEFIKDEVEQNTQPELSATIHESTQT